MLQPENQSKKYKTLFTEIETGRIKIPMFQRDFVWSKEQTTKLIDSIIKGFPIGTFILWQTHEELRHVKNIGNANLPDSPKGSETFYILDGQQRLTSLYAVHKGLQLIKEGQSIDYKDISIDLSCALDDDELVVASNPRSNGPFISVYKLLTGSLMELVQKYNSEDFIKKIDTYRERLTGYDFSTIVISDYPIDIACEIFTRINTAGTELTLFEIMVAKTYDEERKFDLAREYELLIDSNGTSKDLENADFDTIPSSTMLQCIAADICKGVSRKDILKLDKSEFIERWPRVKKGIFTAVDYFRTRLRIPVSRILPYNALLVLFTYFFIRNNGNPPNPDQDKWLIQYFWWASLSRRFSSSVNSKIELDLKRMENILVADPPSYQSEEVSLSFQALKEAEFSTGDAFCKAILCLYAYFEPKSFASNSIVKIDNSWLQRINSKNYHHFFPKDYLSKAGIPDFANSILNITFIDDYLNKRVIRAKPPSEYMRKFKKDNPEIDNTMKTHLIDDLDTYGIWTDDYETFIKHRGERVLEELNKRLRPEES